MYRIRVADFPRSHVFLVVIGLDVEVQLLSNNPLVHLQDLLAGTLEVACGIVRRGEPQTQLFHFGVDWLVYGRHRYEHVHDVAQQVQSWLDFLFWCVSLDCSGDDCHVEAGCTDQVTVADHRDVRV